MIDGLFRAAERDPEDPPGRHRALAAAFLGMLNNYIGLALNSYAGLNDALARHSVHEFLHGALAPPGARRCAAYTNRYIGRRLSDR